MPRTIEGAHSDPTGRFAIVAAKFNFEVVQRLVDGAIAAFRKQGVPDERVNVVWVPGSFEIPLVATSLAASRKYSAIVALGAIIKGDTDHYEYVCAQAAAGVMEAGIATGVPVGFGILTCRTEEQAWDRAGGKEGNKGYDTALAMIEMADLMRKIEGK
jgi:6,7-dimethyl-8-ribityllumazine synthase